MLYFSGNVGTIPNDQYRRRTYDVRWNQLRLSVFRKGKLQSRYMELPVAERGITKSCSRPRWFQTIDKMSASLITTIFRRPIVQSVSHLPFVDAKVEGNGKTTDYSDYIFDGFYVRKWEWKMRKRIPIEFNFGL